MKYKSNNKGNVTIGILIFGLVIWGLISLFSSNSSDTSSDYNYSNSISSYDSDYEDDGYAWAEYNGASSFQECQDQFGTGYEEDRCNEYVKENYSGYDMFNGYDCTEDCSGHEAGYAWAEKNDISDEYDCGGNSSSFIEGCLSYVQDNY